MATSKAVACSKKYCTLLLPGVQYTLPGAKNIAHQEVWGVQ
jgi:hypothetical protein